MIKRPVVTHFVPTDMLLNTARMRDAVHMEPLRFPINPENIALDDAILQGSTLEVQVRKTVLVNEQAEREKAEKVAAKAKEKADEKEKAAKEKLDRLQKKEDEKVAKEKFKAEVKATKDAIKAAKDKARVERERLDKLEKDRKAKLKLDAKEKKAAEAKVKADRTSQR